VGGESWLCQDGENLPIVMNLTTKPKGIAHDIKSDIGAVVNTYQPKLFGSDVVSVMLDHHTNEDLNTSCTCWQHRLGSTKKAILHKRGSTCRRRIYALI